jgi:hypothetical protein
LEKRRRTMLLLYSPNRKPKLFKAKRPCVRNKHPFAGTKKMSGEYFGSPHFICGIDATTDPPMAPDIQSIYHITIAKPFI